MFKIIICKIGWVLDTVYTVVEYLLCFHKSGR
jgi:hypothetical protein